MMITGFPRIRTIEFNNKLKLFIDFIILMISLTLMQLYTLSFFFDIPIHKIIDDHSYNESSQNLYCPVMLSFSLFMLIMDILLTMNTVYIEQGSFVTERAKILSNYFRTNFLWDLVAIVPVFLDLWEIREHASEAALQWMQLLFLCKMRKIQKIMQNFEQILQTNEKHEIILSLVTLVFKIFFVAHTLACFWHFLSFEKRSTETWLSKLGLLDSELHLRYLYSLYWAITTMITVGYGDITPQNKDEVLLCMGSMLLGCAMFGYALNKIGNIFERINAEEREFR
jgi:hypothetical protein